MKNNLYEIESFLIDAVSNIAFYVYPLIGCGKNKKNEIDYIATKCWAESIKLLSSEIGYDIQAISIEGERDGINTASLQKEFKRTNNSIPVALDPIDGTTAGATGCSRCITSIGISFTSNVKYKIIPDEISCFYMASNSDRNFVNNFEFVLPHDVSSNSVVGTIHRQDTEALFSHILGCKNLYSLIAQEGDKGEDGYYLPSYALKNIFFAGDTSIPMFFECGHFIGRTGASEARLEARLWKYWKGLLVSSSKMKKNPISYLKERIRASQNLSKKWDISLFFDDQELSKLYKCGWTNEEILAFHSADSFSPDFDLVLIGSLTGTKDNFLSQHSPYNLKKIYFARDKNALEMEVLVIHKGQQKVLTVPVRRDDRIERPGNF